MTRPIGVFSLAADRLAGSALGDREQTAADSALEMLGYADRAVSPDAMANRLALLRSADLVSAPFRPQTPEAPGAHFFCGTADPAQLGLDAPPMSVGGCDLTPAGAFERCIGESIEYFSQLASGAPESSGCAAGKTSPDAHNSALWEVIERDAVAKWWHGDAPPAPLPLSPYAQNALAGFRGDSALRPTTTLLDITALPGLPVAAAYSFRTDGTGFACGFAAHSHPEAAQKSAIREMIQMELGLLFAEAKPSPDPTDLRQLARAAQVQKTHPALQPSGRPRTHSRPPVPITPQHILNHTHATLAALGMTPYATDLTQAMFAVPVMRVVVDGLIGIPDEASWAEEGRPGTRIPLF